jgi:NADPH:quinone reductase
VRAVLVREFAPLDRLTLADVPAPTPGPGEVLVAVKAAGVNFMDGLIAQGKYQTKPPLPFSPGAEVAGTVKQAGAGVTGISPGMRVLAACGHGGFAEEVIVPAAAVMALPAGMDFAAAASFPIVYGTSHHALKERAQLRAGETLLVLGAAGGVGLTAVEIGKVMGARVIACASSDEKLALCKAYGADELINYATSDLRQKIKELTGGKGVDVVYDPVGGAFAEPCVRSLAYMGRYLVVGFASGEIPKIPLNLLLLKTASLVGVFWGAYARVRPEQNAANFAELFAWYAQGRLKPHVSERFPLAEYAQALDTVMNRRAKGKVVLLVQ